RIGPLLRPWRIGRKAHVRPARLCALAARPRRRRPGRVAGARHLRGGDAVLLQPPRLQARRAGLRATDFGDHARLMVLPLAPEAAPVRSLGPIKRESRGGESMKLLAGNSNQALAEAVSKHLDVPLTKAGVRRFPDNEIWVTIDENVRGEDVFVIQSTSYPANDNLME